MIGHRSLTNFYYLTDRFSYLQTGKWFMGNVQDIIKVCKRQMYNRPSQTNTLTCFGVLGADATVAVETGRAAATDEADVGPPAVHTQHPGEAGATGAGRGHVGGRTQHWKQPRDMTHD